MLYEPLTEITTILTTEGIIVDELMKLPQLIKDQQARFDTTDHYYQYQMASASIAALNKQFFKGKDDIPHAASNDTERRLAVDMALVDTPSVISARKERDLALRELQMVKNRFEAARLLVQLLTRGNGK